MWKMDSSEEYAELEVLHTIDFNVKIQLIFAKYGL